MNGNLERDAVAMAIEKVLLKMGRLEYELVICSLEKEYNCHLPDCHVHPEYLKKVLQDIFGDSYNAIIEQVEQQLGESSTLHSYKDFFEALKIK